MAYDYKGTKITGTSTTAKVFKNSGINNAKSSDTYFNTETGHVYTCTTAGNASNAKWRYTRTDIASKPKLSVTKLGAPVRTTVSGGSRHMKATWKVPSDLTNTKKGDRATGLEVTWWLGIPGKKNKDPKKVKKTGNESLTTHTINLSNITIGSKTYTRSDFYPLNQNRKLTYVSVRVRPYNSKGKGPSSKETRKFKKPRKPNVPKLTFDPSNGQVGYTINTDAGNDYRERYDTLYKRIVHNSHTGTTTTTTYDSTNTTITGSYDVVGYQGLGYDEYVKVTIKAWARGYAGLSEPAERSYYVSYPAKATIVGVDVSSKASDGKCTVSIKTNSTTTHPVDQVVLEYLPNVSYSKTSEIPGDAGWTSSNIVDDAECTALSMPVADLLPDDGKYTWIRVKSWHADEDVLKRYSEPMRLDELYTPAPTAVDDDIVILDVNAGEDGQSAVVLLGWNEDGQDDSTGTELTWSDAEDAWKSTEDPDEHTFTWSDGPITKDGHTYQDSAEIVVKNLDEGTKYYIRARRYLEDEITTYSNYSNTATVFTSEKPETVVAYCDRYVPTGSSLPIYWTFSGNSLQTDWQIIDSSGAVVADGKGSVGSTQVSAERLATFAQGNSVTFTVQVSTGSGFVVSEEHTVTIIDTPTITVNSSGTLTAQPFTFTVTSSVVCDLVVIISSQGASGQFPTGLMRQTEDDTIFSDVLTPTWTASNGGFTTTIELPGNLDFWELGVYSLSVVAIDRDTDLQSDAATESFSVEWAHQAQVPFDYVTLTPTDSFDDNGEHHQSVDIELTPPSGSASSDVYDIYRLTGDSAVLIGEGFPLTYTATDEYAPFGDSMTLYYRVALRTVDGDVEFSDIEYNADGNKLRFDWENGTLELPYNISITDKYKKDTEVRQHMDGSMDGYWNGNVSRTASLSSDVIRLDQQDEVNAARQLARYTGPVFVRTPDGSAYEADVQVSDMSTDGTMTAIAIDATEIGLTSEFQLPTPFVLE